MRDKVFSKKEFIASVTENVKTMYRKTLKEATQQEIYQAVSLAVKDVVMDEWMATQQVIEKDDPKILYYMSMEFLMGRALGNNLINLGAYGEVKEALEEIGLDLSVIEDQEPDPALGNGGLGRLAACFMDSLATLGYAAYGCGIRYRYGMFKQQIIDGFQVEVPDNWLKDGYPFELRRPEYCYEIKFGGHVEETAGEDGNLHFEQVGYQSVLAIPYDMPITGYDNDVVNTLRIWDAEPVNTFNLDSFDRGDYQKAVEQQNLARTICEVLYPNDNHMAFLDELEQEAFFFDDALVNSGRRNPAWGTTDFTLISLPDPDAPGAWSRTYQQKIAQAKVEQKRYEKICQGIKEAKQHALRNRYTLEVYEQTNHLFNFPVRLILALHNYDITIHEQDKQTALQQINEVCNDFQTMRKQLEETYSQTRFMEQPDGYIADQNHHNHLAAKTNNSDWWYYYEIPMIRKTRTWMNSQTARQKNIP